MRRFERPNPLFQPIQERQVIRHSAEERLAKMHVRLHEPRNHRAPVRVDDAREAAHTASIRPRTWRCTAARGRLPFETLPNLRDLPLCEEDLTIGYDRFLRVARDDGSASNEDRQRCRRWWRARARRARTSSSRHEGGHLFITGP